MRHFNNHFPDFRDCLPFRAFSLEIAFGRGGNLQPVRSGTKRLLGAFAGSFGLPRASYRLPRHCVIHLPPAPVVEWHNANILNGKIVTRGPFPGTRTSRGGGSSALFCFQGSIHHGAFFTPRERFSAIRLIRLDDRNEAIHGYKWITVGCQGRKDPPSRRPRIGTELKESLK